MSYLSDQTVKFSEAIAKLDPATVSDDETDALLDLAGALMRKVGEIKQQRADELAKARGWKQ